MSGLKLLLTNDDGMQAPGLAALFSVCQEFGSCVVVAPRTPQSGVGHACTTHRPIDVKHHTENWYSVDGTPVDCARVALTHVAPDADIVIAGINSGGNLGADTYVSGTVAAAREAALLARPSIALSQYLRPDLTIDWERSAELTARVLRLLLARERREGTFWNVNLPHVGGDAPKPELRFCAVDTQPLSVRFAIEPQSGERHFVATYSGDYHNRPRDPGRDVEVCFGGDIAVSSLPLDLHPEE